MKENGEAGSELPEGAVGEICFSGPQIFLGYLNDEEQTNQVISKDGFLYTGDLGSYDDKGLHFAGRRKFLIKPKGYNVFPTEVEDFIEQRFKTEIDKVAIVGLPHDVYSEGIMAFVVLNEGKELSANEIMEATKEIAAYKRPSHIEFVDSDEIPLNRVNKTDYLKLQEIGKKIIEVLREKEMWDKGPVESGKTIDYTQFEKEQRKKGKLHERYDL
jgi:acyl-CoA synthetase (AMP-forming)/AMP-acid ligase II